MQNPHWTDPAFKTMSDADQERTLRNSLLAGTDARQWIGMLAYHGDELRELDYPGYTRQQYDGSKYFRFLFAGITEPMRVNAMGLYHERVPSGRGEREKPIIIHLVANTMLFTVKRGDKVQVETGSVLG